MIIRGGENIYATEVENVLYDHPAVTDAALIGLPHRTLGEEPAAVVHLAPGTGASEDELRAFVRERLAAFKVPVRIAFSEDTLPRNANGKILKGDLKFFIRLAVRPLSLRSMRPQIGTAHLFCPSPCDQTQIGSGLELPECLIGCRVGRSPEEPLAT